MTEYHSDIVYVVDGMAAVRHINQALNVHIKPIFCTFVKILFHEMEIDQKELILFLTFMKTIQ